MIGITLRKFFFKFMKWEWFFFVLIFRRWIFMEKEENAEEEKEEEEESPNQMLSCQKNIVKEDKRAKSIFDAENVSLVIHKVKYIYGF